VADVVWDASLPTMPLMDAYDEALAENTIRSQMEGGPAKVRRRFTSGVRKFSVAFRMTDTQAATLDTFYTDDTYSGSVAFELTHPRTGATLDFRFVTAPRITCQSPTIYTATFELEVLP
jgi:hypothetical protein